MASLAIAGEAISCLVAQGIIQNINPALFYWDRVCPPKIGPGEGRHHTHEGQHAQGKKHEIAQPQRAAAWFRLIIQEAKCRKLNQVCLLLAP